MENDQLIAIATEEIKNPVFGVTEQFLQVHEVAYEGGKPVVAGIKVIDETDAAVYFSVKGEKFHLVIYLDTKPEIQVRWADIEDYCRVYFRATSKELTFQQLAALTTLPPNEGWSKGDKRKNSTNLYTFSSLELALPQEPGAFEDNIGPLLNILEQDPVSIRQLVELFGGGIQAHIIFHNGNTMPGGAHLDQLAIRRLAALNLSIDFDLYAEGNFFED